MTLTAPRNQWLRLYAALNRARMSLIRERPHLSTGSLSEVLNTVRLVIEERGDVLTLTASNQVLDFLASVVDGDLRHWIVRDRKPEAAR